MSEAEKTLERAPLAKGEAGSTLEIRAEDIVVEESVVRPTPSPPPAGAGATQELRAVDFLEEKVELNLPPPPPPSVPASLLPVPPPPALPIFTARTSSPSLSVPVPVPVPVLALPPPPPPSVPRVEQHSYPSVAPLALDLPIPPPPRPIRLPYFAEATLQLPRVQIRRNLGWVVASAVGLSLVILTAGVVRRAYVSYVQPAASVTSTAVAARTSSPPAHATDAGRAASPPPVAAPAPPPSRPAANGSVPTIDLDSLPRTGTIRAAKRRTLLIDGTSVAGMSAVVPCGEHTVQLGAGREHSVDVPCGGTAYVR